MTSYHSTYERPTRRRVENNRPLVAARSELGRKGHRVPHPTTSAAYNPSPFSGNEARYGASSSNSGLPGRSHSNASSSSSSSSSGYGRKATSAVQDDDGGASSYIGGRGGGRYLDPESTSSASSRHSSSSSSSSSAAKSSSSTSSWLRNLTPSRLMGSARRTPPPVVTTPLSQGWSGGGGSPGKAPACGGCGLGTRLDGGRGFGGGGGGEGGYGDSGDKFTSGGGGGGVTGGDKARSGFKKKLCCDACDGAHDTHSCPHFKKKRDAHKDAQKGKGASIGGSGGDFTLRSARVVRQPGDGSCLFHSMAFGIGSVGCSAGTLRRQIGDFINKNPNLEIADTPMKDWVKWDSNTSVSTYASRISRSGWGGGIEMAACSRMKKVNIHVYEASGQGGGGFKRISCFDAPGASKTVHVLYRGGVHYDALVPYR